MKKSIFWLILFLFVLLLLEGISYSALFFLKEYRNIEYSPAITDLKQNQKDSLKKLIKNELSYYKFSKELGWAPKENGFSDEFGYRADSHGIRSDREYTLTPSVNKFRISTFGDSFTEGAEVTNKETWEEELTNINPLFEVINFGVGGYGTDQAYLRYIKDGIKYNSHIVFLGLLTENIHRSVSTFRPFYVPNSMFPLGKPRFIVKDDKLQLIENPIQDVSQLEDLVNDSKNTLPTLGKYDYYYNNSNKQSILDFFSSLRLYKVLKDIMFNNSIYNLGYAKSYYDKEREEFIVTAKIIEKFVETALENDSLPIILVFPNAYDITRYQKFKTKIHQPLIDNLYAKGFLYIDLLDAFFTFGKGKMRNEFFAKGGHYSPLGNEVVAKYLSLYLNRSNFDSKNKINEAKEHLKSLISTKNN